LLDDVSLELGKLKLLATGQIGNFEELVVVLCDCL
jgi:hypothetical protein